MFALMRPPADINAIAAAAPTGPPMQVLLLPSVRAAAAWEITT